MLLEAETGELEKISRKIEDAQKVLANMTLEAKLYQNKPFPIPNGVCEEPEEQISLLDTSNPEELHTDGTKELLRTFRRLLKKITQDCYAVTVLGIECLPITTPEQLIQLINLVLKTAMKQQAFTQQMALVYKVLADSFKETESALLSSFESFLKPSEGDSKSAAVISDLVG